VLRPPAAGTIPASSTDTAAVVVAKAAIAAGFPADQPEVYELAESLLAQTITAENVPAQQLMIHANRRSSMASKPVALLLADLGVIKSHSRPRVSNDPHSESQFKTLKYCPSFPGTFVLLEDARAFCAEFFHAYNNHHRHAGLGLLTPAVVHPGQAQAVQAKRALVLDAAHARHGIRFQRPPQPPRLPEPAWINRPADKEDDTQK